MSTFHLVVALCLGLPLLANGSPKECMTTVEGFTWDYEEDIDELIIGVDTVDLCYNACADDTECRGYTWTNAVVQTCYKFNHELRGYHECKVCSSGVPSQSVEGACVGEDILDVGTTDSIEECRQFCLKTDGCKAYTWWDNTSLFINTCFLYGGCKTRRDCEGCVSGRINCIFTGPNQCVEYMVLDDPDRSVNNEDCDCVCVVGICSCDECYVDRSANINDRSSDWQGSGYYRIMSSAGNRLPESAPGYKHCGTVYPGYLRGEHPQDIYAEKEMLVYFSRDGMDYCNYEQANITVTNCNGFFVYWLPDTSPRCYFRYCVTQ